MDANVIERSSSSYLRLMSGPASPAFNRRHLRSLTIPLLLSAIVAVACGGAAQPASTSPAAATSAPAATATATPTPTTEPVGGTTFTVTVGKVTVAVREQLASLPAPNDAVLVTEDVTGSFTLLEDGSFTSDSKVDAGLTTLTSDSRQRDSFVKRNTLNTQQFPTATFVPTKLEGVTFPLADGSFSGRLSGQMTIRGTTKEVAWDVTGEKSGDRITVTTKNAPSWKFGDFGLEIPRVFSVLSIVDEIRLEVQLEATAD